MRRDEMRRDETRGGEERRGEATKHEFRVCGEGHRSLLETCFGQVGRQRT